MVKSSPTGPDLGMSGYLVLVVRLVAGVPISVSVFPSGVSRRKAPFWGWTKIKLAAFYVNVNCEAADFSWP